MGLFRVSVSGGSGDTVHTICAEKNLRSNLVHPFILGKLCLASGLYLTVMFSSAIVLKIATDIVQVYQFILIVNKMMIKQMSRKLKIHFVWIISRVRGEVRNVPGRMAVGAVTGVLW